MSIPGVLPELPDVPGGWTERIVDLENRSVRVALPAGPDAILDHAVTLEQNRIDDYMPYWCWLWPAASQMATTIGRLPLPPNGRGLEIGSGLGLVGTAAMLAGLDIVLSDYRDEAVQVAKHNAALNGFPAAAVRKINWREEPTLRFDYVVACDVLYETSEHHPILDFVEAILREKGECWIGDPGRSHAADFVKLAEGRFDVQLLDLSLNELLQPSQGEFFLIHLIKPDGRQIDFDTI